MMCLKANMKCLDPLSSMQKKLALFIAWFWRRKEKKKRRRKKIGPLWRLSLFILSKMFTKISSGFCHAISASRCFIWATKQHCPMILNFHFSKGEPFWFRGEGMVKNGFQSVYIGPYGFPHTYKCQANIYSRISI